MAYEQLGETFDVPVTVTLQYADGTSEDIVIPMIDEAGTHVVPLRGALRNVEINRDDAALGTFERLLESVCSIRRRAALQSRRGRSQLRPQTARREPF